MDCGNVSSSVLILYCSWVKMVPLGAAGGARRGLTSTWVCNLLCTPNYFKVRSSNNGEALIQVGEAQAIAIRTIPCFIVFCTIMKGAGLEQNVGAVNPARAGIEVAMGGWSVVQGKVESAEEGTGERSFWSSATYQSAFFRQSTAAPRSSRYRTQSRWPMEAASCRGRL